MQAIQTLLANNEEPLIEARVQRLLEDHAVCQAKLREVRIRTHFIEIEYFKRRLRPVTFIILYDNFRHYDDVFLFEEKFRVGKRQITIDKKLGVFGERKDEAVPFDFFSQGEDWLPKALEDMTYLVLGKLGKSICITRYEGGLNLDPGRGQVSEYWLADRKDLGVTLNLMSRSVAKAEAIIKALIFLVARVVVMSATWTELRGASGQLDIVVEIIDLHDGAEDREQVMVTRKAFEIQSPPELLFRLGFLGDQVMHLKMNLLGMGPVNEGVMVPTLRVTLTVFREDVLKSAGLMGQRLAADFAMWIEERLQDQSKVDASSKAHLSTKMSFFRGLSAGGERPGGPKPK